MIRKETELTQLYVNGINAYRNGCVGITNSYIGLLELEKKDFPDYNVLINTYINNLEVALNTNNPPIGSDIKGLCLENKIK